MAVVVNGTAMIEMVIVPGATISTDTLGATISQLLFKVGIGCRPRGAWVASSSSR